jgi:hypothetical protein
MLPFTYDALAERFATIRPWAKNAIGDATNRCAICMGYTMRITPSGDDATIETIMTTELGTSFKGAAAPAGGPQSGVLRGSGQPLRGLSQLLFIRASELLPRVQRAYGPADIEGVCKDVSAKVLGRKGVLYLENCYQTTGDKKHSFLFFQWTSGDHWDLFDGTNIVAQEQKLAGNRHSGQLHFWQAR